MIPNPVSMTNSREYDGVVRVPDGVAPAIESVGGILMSFQSDFGEIDLQLLNVTFVPLLSYNLLWLKQFARRAGHSYRGDGDGVILFCKSSRSLFAPHCRETRSNARISYTKRQCMCNNRPYCETPRHRH